MPVVLIGRLAIDREVHGQGLGEFLLVDAIRRAKYLAAKVGSGRWKWMPLMKAQGDSTSDTASSLSLG